MFKNHQPDDQSKLLWNYPERVISSRKQKFMALAISIGFIVFVAIVIILLAPDSLRNKLTILGFILLVIAVMTGVALVAPPKDEDETKD